MRDIGAVMTAKKGSRSLGLLLSLSLVFFSLAFVPASAADFSSGAKGKTTAAFLKLGVGARAAGMGEAFGAVADDAGALYWNPAGLNKVVGKSATFMHAAYLESSFFDYGAYAQRLGEKSVVGASLQYFSAGSITETDATGTTIGSFTPSDVAFAVGYARKYNGASLGGAVKLIQSKVKANANTAAVDLGVLLPAYRGGKLTLGLAVTNLGGKLKFDSAQEDLPLLIRASSAYKIRDAWTAALDIGFPKDNRPFFALGTEVRMAVRDGRSLSGRAGYNTRTAGDVSGFTGVSFGLGFNFRTTSLDYAIAPLGDLGLAHRVSLTTRF